MTLPEQGMPDVSYMSSVSMKLETCEESLRVCIFHNVVDKEITLEEQT